MASEGMIAETITIRGHNKGASARNVGHAAP
jgi:hypothetical protein